MLRHIRAGDKVVLLEEKGKNLSSEQLAQWRDELSAFLATELHLGLKERTEPAPLGNGADFLGYIVRPGYRLVRRRVVGNLHERLVAFERELVRRNRAGTSIDLPLAARQRLQAILASYWGHFRHADSYRLRQGIFRDFPWLHLFFRDPVDLRPRWQPILVSSLASLWRYFEREFPACLLIVQCGRQLLLNAELPGLPPYRGPARLRAWRVEIGNLAGLQARLRRYRCSYLFCSEEGYLQGGLKRRVLRRIWLSAADGLSALIPPNLKEKIL